MGWFQSQPTFHPCTLPEQDSDWISFPWRPPHNLDAGIG
jgi:hypothetical protein